MVEEQSPRRFKPGDAARAGENDGEAGKMGVEFLHGAWAFSASLVRD